jgi:hypothetical protein
VCATFYYYLTRKKNKKVFVGTKTSMCENKKPKINAEEQELKK